MEKSGETNMFFHKPTLPTRSPWNRQTNTSAVLSWFPSVKTPKLGGSVVQRANMLGESPVGESPVVFAPFPRGFSIFNALISMMTRA